MVYLFLSLLFVFSLQLCNGKPYMFLGSIGPLKITEGMNIVELILRTFNSGAEKKSNGANCDLVSISETSLQMRLSNSDVKDMYNIEAHKTSWIFNIRKEQLETLLNWQHPTEAATTTTSSDEVSETQTSNSDLVAATTSPLIDDTEPETSDENEDEVTLLGRVGNLTINLQKNNEIFDCHSLTVQIKCGWIVISKKTLTNYMTSVYFENIPYGEYSVALVGVSLEQNEVFLGDVEVSSNFNEATLIFDNIGPISVMSQKLEFFGEYNKKFAELVVNMYKMTATFVVSSVYPHSAYEQFLYASVKIASEDGRIVYDKEVYGKTITSSDLIPLKENYIIEVYHDEADRLNSTDSIINMPSLLNRYQVTKFGLKNIDMSYDPQLFSLFKIDDFGRKIIENNDNEITCSSFDKKHLAIAINLLNQPYQNIIKKKYACVLPYNLEDEMKFQTEDSLGESFATKVVPSNSDEIFNYYKLTEEPVAEGEQTENYYHQSLIKKRSLLNNESMSSKEMYDYELSDTTEEKSREVNEVKDSSRIINSEKTDPDSSMIDESFEIDGYWGLLGTFKTYLNKNYARFITNANNPNKFLGRKTYITLKVTNASGENTYHKILLGLYTERIDDKIPINIGDTIELYHAETSWKVRCDCNILDKQNTTNKWLVTKYGLKSLNLNNDPLNDLLEKIDIEAPKVIYYMKNFEPKAFEEPYHSYFRSKYQCYLSGNDIQDIQVCGKDIYLHSYKKQLDNIRVFDATTNKTVKLALKLGEAILSLKNQYRRIYQEKYADLFSTTIFCY